MRRGFTLIEISIVLLVIGLLVAGVIVGQSMLRTSRLQTIVTDVSVYQNAIVQFRQKYNAVPGDMSSAQSTWGVNANCAVAAGVGTGKQTCNGNGDSHIDVSGSAPFEQFAVWQHLANDGFIAGKYTGTSVSGATAPTLYCSPTSNCPGGKVSQQQAYFIQYSTGALGSTSYYWDQPAGHYLIVGAAGLSTSANGYPGYPLLTASEALSLDGKVDDGLPGMGLWRSFEATGGAGYLPNCVVISGTTSAPANGTLATQASSVYYSAYGTRPACSFEISLGF